MKLFKEETQWDWPNHYYYLSDDKSKMYAYVRNGTSKVNVSSKPVRFDSRGRKFKEVPNYYGYTKAEEAPVVLGKEYKVAGSDKNVYSVREHLGEWTCTCPASKWQKGECKHVKQIKAQAQPA